MPADTHLAELQSGESHLLFEFLGLAERGGL
jgi:hypothetical protein